MYEFVNRWWREVGVPLAVVFISVIGWSSPAQAQTDRADATLAKMQSKALASAMKDITSRKVEARRDAAKTLGQFADAADQVVPVLATALADSDATVRERAASSLWKLREAAAPAQDALRRVLTDPSPAVRVQAAGALEAIGIDPAELVASRRTVVAEGDWFDRALAIRDLIGHVEAAELAAPLMRAIRDTPPAVRAEDPDGRFSALSIVARLAKTGEPGVISPMMAALAEPDMPHAEIVTALATFDPEPDGWVNTLIRLARDPDAATRKAVAEALEHHAKQPEGGAGWPEQVVHLLSDRDREVRWQAVNAFGAAGGHAHAAAPTIASIASATSDEGLSKAAIRALGTIGDVGEAFDTSAKTEVATVAAPVLLSIVDSSSADDDLRREAMEAYTKLALDPGDAVRELSRIAGGSFPDRVRIIATRGFWSLGRDAESALPLLERLTSDPETLVAAAARSAIDDITHGVAMPPPTTSTGSAPGGSDVAAAQAWLRAHDLRFDHDGFNRALIDKNADAVEHYLAAGMSAVDAGTTGIPPLHTAVMFGCPWGQPTPAETARIVAALLAAGADPNAKDEQGNPSLHRAVTSCDGSVISQLLAAGADMHAANATGMSPFGLAAATNPSAAEAFLAAGYKITPAEATQYADWFTDEPEKRELLERAGLK